MYRVTEAIPEAIKDDCASCSDKQKEGARKVIRFLHDKKPKAWEAVLMKYDPRGDYREKYEKDSSSLFKER